MVARRETSGVRLVTNRRVEGAPEPRGSDIVARLRRGIPSVSQVQMFSHLATFFVAASRQDDRPGAKSKRGHLAILIFFPIASTAT
jgi:hypothetical protein